MRARGQVDVAAGEAILSVENVSLAFGGVKALSDVSFDIRKGEIRAIIGPNGAGKTSMLNVINGFYQPQHGPHHLQGQDALANASPRGGARRHRAHLPERRAVSRHDRARQHHGRPLAGDAREFLLAAAALRAGAERGGRASAARRGHHRFPRDRRISARSRSGACPMACRSASSSAARSRWSRTCCCSTSRWPA